MTAIKRSDWWIALPTELAIDLRLLDPDQPPPREPTPEQKALDILAPYLATEPLYQP
ncbi:hypothetical protein ACIRLA_22165 [Streptomyces sp. NPDC102364]|uniref:hypothetical protein n=1 Tax=Streptomyces sp. NPDC102364 TaxID=3366161 RepID=UPI0037F57713